MADTTVAFSATDCISRQTTTKEEYETAGLTRNVREAQYKQAAERSGAESDEAKKAKDELDKAQADLEAKQKAYKDLLANGGCKKEEAPKPEAKAEPKPAPALRPVQAQFHEITRVRVNIVRTLHFNSEQIQRLLREVRQPVNGESSHSLEFFRKPAAAIIEHRVLSK